MQAFFGCAIRVKPDFTQVGPGLSGRAGRWFRQVCDNGSIGIGPYTSGEVGMQWIRWAGAMALCCGLLAFAPARAGGDVSCKMTFQLSGWSVFYKTAKGSGTVHCSNGQSMHVKLRAKGGGLTFGKTRITDGHGTFSGIHGIRDVLGHYATAEAHAGTEGDAAKAQVMTKGDVSMALTGKGSGWNLGVAFGAFIIEQ